MTAEAGRARGGEPETAPSVEDTTSERKANRLALLFLFLVWLAFIHPVFGQKVLFPVDIGKQQSPQSLYAAPPSSYNPFESDAYEQVYPIRSYLAERLRDGELPLWEPYRLAGIPYLANSHTAVFYPLNWLFLSGRILTSITLIEIFSPLIALLLAFWFFRLLHLHAWGAAVAAVMFAYCGFLVAWTVHPGVAASGIWLPLALGGVELAVGRNQKRGIGLAALALGLSVLGGLLQVTLYVWLMAGIWALVLLGSKLASREPATFRAVLLPGLVKSSFIFLLGGAVAAVQLLATGEYAMRIVRIGQSFERIVAGYSLENRYLTTLFIPDQLGNPVDRNFVANVNYTEAAMYVGVFSLVLAALGLWSRHRRLVIAFSLFALFGYLGTFGSPLFRPFFEWIPSMDRMRAISRMVFFIDVGLAGLAALGVDTLIRAGRRMMVPLVLASSAVLAVVELLLLRIDSSGLTVSYLLPRYARATFILIAGAAACALLILRPRWSAVMGGVTCFIVGLDIFLWGFRYHRFQEPDAIYPVVPEIAHVTPSDAGRERVITLGWSWFGVNGALAHRLFGIEAYDTYLPANMVDILSLASGERDKAHDFNTVGHFDMKVGSHPIIDLLGVVYAVGPPDHRFGSESFRGRLPIMRRASAFDPAFQVTCWDFVPASQTLERLARMDRKQLGSRAVVADRPANRTALGDPPGEDCPPGEPVKTVKYAPEQIVLRTSTDSRSLLVLSDTWYPGWRARVSGEDVPVVEVDHALRGVPLEPGTHTVEFYYRPWWLVPGLICSVVAAIASALLALERHLPFARRRDSSRQPLPEPVQ